jgi:predicted metal-dependent hydrolase
MRVEFEDLVVEYDVQYGKGKKIVISMDSIGFVSVKAPNNTSEITIVDVIKQHAKVIKQRQENISKSKDRFREKSYGGEGKFLHLGKEFFLDEFIDTKELSEDELRINLKKFYILSCKKIVNQRIKVYQEQLRVKPKSIEVDESNTKWGACTSSKKITFNYRLAMAPIESIDYVVVHELCHLLHMNHDRSFWRKIGSILPDYKKREEYLKKYGPFMTL